MKNVLIPILLFISLITNAQSDMKLIYVGDPMCSWCYGFAPELDKVIENAAKDNVEVEFVMGGLRPYYNKPISEMKDFLSEHWHHVNEASGQPFTYDILDRSDLNYDTEPPARAVVIMREMAPKHVGAFFADTQKMFYAQNMDMNVSESYHKSLKALNLDTDTFDKHFHSEEMKMRIKEDFERARALGVSSFPTLLMMVDEDVLLVANGYVTSEEIYRRIDRILKSRS